MVVWKSVHCRPCSVVREIEQEGDRHSNHDKAVEDRITLVPSCAERCALQKEREHDKQECTQVQGLEKFLFYFGHFSSSAIPLVSFSHGITASDAPHKAVFASFQQVSTTSMSNDKLTRSTMQKKRRELRG